MKDRILIISAVFPPEQVTSAFLNYDLAHELAKDYEVTVLRPYPTRPIGMKFDYHGMGNEPFETILIDSYTHPQSSLIGRFRESIDFGRKCAAYIEKHHEEIAFIYNNPWQLFGVNIVARKAHKYHIPYTVAIQDIYPECLFTNKKYPAIIQNVAQSLLKPIDKYYQKNAAFIRTISDEMADYLSSSRHLPRDKYLVVNNWQNDEDFSPLTKETTNDKLVFAYVGSINVHSNVDLIIRAFHQADLQNAEFRIYGGGNRTEQCKALVKELGVKNVTFDMVSRDRVPEVQGAADVLVLALPKGNGELCLPSKITSYMLSSKPILACVDLDSATNRYLREANCGMVVESDNESALAIAFEEFSKMKKERLVDMGRSGKCVADKHLTKTVNLKMVVDAIKDCINRKKGENR